VRRVETDDGYVPMTEAQLKSLIGGLAIQNGWVVKQSTQNREVRPSRRSVSAGYPDLTCARDKEVVFMEVKDQKGEVSPEQWVWLQALPASHVIRPSDWYSGRVAELLA
jgi:hypothetical protein